LAASASAAFCFLELALPLLGLGNLPPVVVHYATVTLLDAGALGRKFQSSSPMPRQIRARSTWHRPAAGLRPTSPASVQDDDRRQPRDVPYRGAGPVLVDLLAGVVQVYFSPTPPAIEYIKAGKLRALAVTTALRSEALPDIPTVGEFVPGYEASSWFGVGTPKATPAEIVEKLNKEVNAGLADPRLKARLADLGGIALAGSPADFGKLIAEETEKWAKVIKFAGIKLE
jgi:Tripartite tricarboxylate transporter family receptor